MQVMGTSEFSRSLKIIPPVAVTVAVSNPAAVLRIEGLR